MRRDISLEAFADYFQGNLNDRERRLFEERLQSDPEFKSAFQAYTQLRRAESAAAARKYNLGAGFETKIMRDLEDECLGFWSKTKGFFAFHARLLAGGVATTAMLLVGLKIAFNAPFGDSLKHTSVKEYSGAAAAVPTDEAAEEALGKESAIQPARPRSAPKMHQEKHPPASEAPQKSDLKTRRFETADLLQPYPDAPPRNDAQSPALQPAAKDRIKEKKSEYAMGPPEKPGVLARKETKTERLEQPDEIFENGATGRDFAERPSPAIESRTEQELAAPLTSASVEPRLSRRSVSAAPRRQTGSIEKPAARGRLLAESATSNMVPFEAPAAGHRMTIQGRGWLAELAGQTKIDIIYIHPHRGEQENPPQTRLKEVAVHSMDFCRTSPSQDEGPQECPSARRPADCRSSKDGSSASPASGGHPTCLKVVIAAAARDVLKLQSLAAQGGTFLFARSDK